MNNFKIIVPVRNARFYIGKCLDSIKSQLFKNFECVVIDDCSMDNTLAVIQEKVIGDNRFKVIVNSERKWALENTIMGTQLIAKNPEDIILVVDGDDRLIDNRVLNYLDYVYKNEEVWATYGQYQSFSGYLGGSCPLAIGVSFCRHSFIKTPISHLRTYKNFLFTKVKKEDLQDDTNNYFKVVGDMALFWPIAEMAGGHLKFISKVLYLYNDLTFFNDYKINKEEQLKVTDMLLSKPPYRILDRDLEYVDNKIDIKVIDKNFAHQEHMSPDPPEYIRWYRGRGSKKIVIYTDTCLEKIETDNSYLIKVAWLLEPSGINKTPYLYISKNYYKFDFVLTYNKSLLDSLPNAVFMPSVGTWLFKKDFKIYPKTKNLVIIASEKKDTPLHVLRHSIISRFKDKFDLVGGKDYLPIGYKLDALKDYRYSVVIQNTYQDYYFTDSLLDCFLTGTVPIFCGCPSIGDFFDKDGIITFKNILEFEKLLYNLNEKDYFIRREAIKNNFLKVLEYQNIEDYLYLNFIQKLNSGDFIL